MDTRDYVALIAAALRNERPEPHWDANKRTQWDLCMGAIADALSADTRSFNEERYVALIAAALRNERPEPHWDANKRAQWDLCVRAIADALSADTRSFNEERFVIACGGYFNAGGVGK